MLSRVNELLNEKVSFAIETTLATKIYKNKILEAQNAGYSVILLFFWLKNVELAKERVKLRVSEGGHNIEPEVIERRYITGIKNLFEIYLPLADTTLIFDNSDGKHEIIAKSNNNPIFEISNIEKFNILKKYGHD